MIWQLFGLFCFCTLSCSEARGSSRGRRKNTRRGPSRGGGGYGERAPSPAPKVDKFEFAVELDAETWAEKVETVANHSLKPLYHPMIMFHISTCQYCQATLPEFEHAAKMIDKAQKDGNLKGLSAEVKFFMFQCDKSPKERAICDKHPGAGVPMLKLFRDQRELAYTGERWAKKIAEWSVHVSRPVLLQCESKADLDKYAEAGGVVFMMSAKAAEDRDILRAWGNLAYEHIEDTYFCVVPLKSEASSEMHGESVGAYGKGIEVLPLEGTVTEKSLQKWVDLNKWKVVNTLTQDNALKFLHSGRIVVVYAYKFQRGMQLDEVDPKFREKAKEMRQSGKYLFAAVDCWKRENANFLTRMFPGVQSPSMFIFPGNITLKSDLMYWESPTLRPKDLSFFAMDDLMADDWARHDNGKVSWAKAWGKWFYRFGTGTGLGFFLLIVLPLVVGLMLYCCIRELWTSDEPDLKTILKESQNKENRKVQTKEKKDVSTKAEPKDGSEKKDIAEKKDTDENEEPAQKDDNAKKEE